MAFAGDTEELVEDAVCFECGRENVDLLKTYGHKLVQAPSSLNIEWTYEMGVYETKSGATFDDCPVTLNVKTIENKEHTYKAASYIVHNAIRFIVNTPFFSPKR